MALQIYPFAWSNNQNSRFQFSPVIDGITYFVYVGYLDNLERFYVELQGANGEVLCNQPLIASPDNDDLQLFSTLNFTDNLIYRASSKSFEFGGVKRSVSDLIYSLDSVSFNPAIPPYVPPTISYSIHSDSSTVAEGEDAVFVVNTVGVGTATLYFTVNHITTNDDDLLPLNGEVYVDTDYGTFAISALSDFLSEDDETFSIQLRTDSIAGDVVATSNIIIIANVTIPITYSVTPESLSMNETYPSYGSLSVDVHTTGLPASTFYWTIDHIDTNAADFLAESGAITTNDYGNVRFYLSAMADHTTEGDETFRVQLRTDSISGTVVATSDIVTIIDTSRTPFYSITPDGALLIENQTMTFDVVANNTGYSSLYYSIHNITTSAGTADIYNVFNTQSGSFALTDIGGDQQTGSFTLKAKADSVIETDETFEVYLRTVSTSGTIVATSAVVTIRDRPTINVVADLTTAAPLDTVNYTVTVLNGVDSTIDFNIINGGYVDPDTLTNPASGTCVITGGTGSFSVDILNLLPSGSFIDIFANVNDIANGKSTTSNGTSITFP